MALTPYERFRMLMSSPKPPRFEASMSYFRNLHEVGGSSVADSNGVVDQATQLDPLSDKGVKEKLIKHNLAARQARFETLKRLRRLSLTDFNMIGGVAPTGAMSGSGGSEGYRPVSLSARS